MRAIVTGPFWTAQLEVLTLDDPVKNLALRAIFVDRAGASQASELLRVPGTQLLLGKVGRLEVRVPGASEAQAWTARAATPGGEAEDLEARIHRGELALLLVTGGSPAADQDLGDFRCLGGEIHLRALEGQGGAESELYQSLTLRALASPAEEISDLGRFSAHAGGLSIDAGTLLTTLLPEDQSLVEASFVLSPDKKRGGSALTVEKERLTASESRRLGRAWRNLAALLNPKSAATAPHWITLEVNDAVTIPRLSWHYEEGANKPTLRFDTSSGNLFTILLTDRSPYDESSTPTTLARILPDEVVVDDDRREIRVARGARVEEDVDVVRLRASREQELWKETVSTARARVSFDAIRAAAFVRARSGLPDPELAGGGVEPALLWATTPLEDGWAEIPVPNLNEQIYLDTKLDREHDLKNSEDSDETQSDPEEEAIIQGVVSWGNDSREVLEAHGDENPWQFSLTHAESFVGTWKVSDDSKLEEVAAEITGAGLVLSGLLPLATAAPTIGDALPVLDDWTASLESVALRTERARPVFFPPLVTMTIEGVSLERRTEAALADSTDDQADGAELASLHSARLEGWSMAVNLDEEMLDGFAAAKVFNKEAFERDFRARFWRRHPSLPLIQTLPLTQNQYPPRFPAASRELAPFELQVDGSWALEVGSGAAARWPTVQSLPGQPEIDWRAAILVDEFDLPMASLSLPGLVFDAKETAIPGFDAPASFPLAMGYRHDLPYADEVQALAGTEEEEGSKGDEAGDVTTIASDAAPANLPEEARDDTSDDEGDDPLRPLDRDSFAAHWRTLSTRASLARADATDALFANGPDVDMKGLVEPAVLPVTPRLHSEGSAAGNAAGVDYPGALSLTAGLDPLSGTDALGGISGKFSMSGKTLSVSPEGKIDIVGGGMSAWTDEEGAARDQRGLGRRETRSINGNSKLLTTPIDAHGTASSFGLTTTLEPLQFEVAGQNWRFYFRDLPVQEGVFDRGATISGAAQDINDPGARSVVRDVRAGYEWRLGSSEPRAALRVVGLEFFPLTLESVVVREGEVRSLEIIGRLQLPIGDGGVEMIDGQNAVRLGFDRSSEIDAPLTLRSVELADQNVPGVWPLSADADGNADSAELEWRVSGYQPEDERLELDVTLRFGRFGREWKIPFTDKLQLARGAASAGVAQDIVEHEKAPLHASRLEVTVSPTGAQPHEATLHFEAAMFDKSGPLLDARLSIGLLDGQDPGGASAPVLSSLRLFNAIDLEGARVVLRDRAVQFEWTAGVENETARLLPGVPLDASRCRGFATFVFTAKDVSEDDDASSIPLLFLDAGYIETLLFSRFENKAASVEPPSSRGDLVVGFAARWGGSEWESKHSVNGFLELSNLISWAGETVLPAERKAASLPGDEVTRRVHHVMRILFNQHELPVGALNASVRNPADFNWEFSAVVEQRLLIVESDFSTGTLKFELREGPSWTAAQRVRLAGPARVKADLSSLRFGRDGGPVAAKLYGAMASGLRELLIEGLETLPEEDGELVFAEASAPFWIRKSPVQAPSFASLENLPNGLMRAVLSDPGEFSPSDPEAPEWLLLSMPFFGRLDASTNRAEAETHPLLVGPVTSLAASSTKAQERLLARALANRSADGRAAKLEASFLDRPEGRLFARLDPIALEENWFRMQDIASERAARSSELTTVLATPNVGPGRLSRTGALGDIDASARVLTVFDGVAAGVAPGAGNELENPEFSGELPLTLLPRDSNERQPLSRWLLSGDSASSFDALTLEVLRTEDRSGLRLRGLENEATSATFSVAQDVSLQPGEYEFSIAIVADSLMIDPGQRSRSFEILLGDEFTEVSPSFEFVEPGGTARISVRARVETAGSIRAEFIIKGPLGSMAWSLKDPRLERLPAPASLGWALTGIQLGALFQKEPGLSRHAAVSVLSPSASAEEAENSNGTPAEDSKEKKAEPLAFMVSPYLGTEFIPVGESEEDAEADAETADVDTPLFVSAELLGLDEATGKFRSMASQFWEAEPDFLALAQAWGLETQSRLNPSSPVAALRFRKIRAVDPLNDSDGSRSAAVDYSFSILPLPVANLNAARLASMRAPVAQLRFREGQFGGFRMPEQAWPFELAPPQVRGLQSLRPLESPRELTPWPWGFSGWRVSVQYTRNGVSVADLPQSEIAGGSSASTCWWQAPALNVQYRFNDEASRPQAGLPKLFRARSISSLIPVLPKPLLPRLDLQTPKWQPVLPGDLRYVVTGSRAGVFMALRHQLIRQRVIGDSDIPQEILVSGSVPVQHRVPRPVPLPAPPAATVLSPPTVKDPRSTTILNPALEQQALRTWASPFDSQRSVLAASSPHDEARFAAAGDTPARRFRLILVDPARGELDASWDQKFSVDLRMVLRPSDRLPKEQIADWIRAEFVVGRERFTLSLGELESASVLANPEGVTSPTQVTVARIPWTLNPEDETRWRSIVSLNPTSETMALEFRVGHDTETSGYRQILRLPLRFADRQRPRLPLTPHYLRFEDPEYNRRLASAPMQVQTTVPIRPTGATEDTLRPLQLAADRREYNSDSVISLRYDWDLDGSTSGAELLMKRLTRGGISSDVSHVALTDSFASGQLLQLDLGKATLPVDAPPFEPGDVLEIQLTMPTKAAFSGAGAGEVSKETILILRVPLVADSVIPAPEAALALLHRRTSDRAGVHCARFAWGAAPTRTELLNPDDLRSGIVRRYATFSWLNTTRAGSTDSYAIQKITRLGSTHVPELDEFVPVLRRGETDPAPRKEPTR